MNKIMEALGTITAAALLIVVAVVGYGVILTIPIYFLWNWLVPKYFYFLPAVWLNLPFWETMGLVFLFSFIGKIIFKASVETKKNKE